MQAPGPSAWSFVRAVRKRGFLDALGELWKTHGDVFQVKVGSRHLVFAMHPDAVTHAMTTHKRRYTKGESHDDLRELLLGQGLVTSTGDLWRRQRRLMAPFFTPKGSLEYLDVIRDDALRFRDRWRELAQTNANVDMDEEMASVTASIILKALFSTDRMDSIHTFKVAVESMIEFATQRLTGPGLPMWVPTPGNRRYKASRALANETVETLIRERRATPEAQWPEDFLSHMMSARDPETGEAMPDDLLHDEAFTLFVAGYETTARTMMFAWLALAQNLDVAARLHAELDDVLGGRTPSLDDLKKLPYTMRVVKETLRLYPAPPLYTRDAAEDDVIGGFDIPKGAQLMLSPFYTQRHPEFWDRPEVFDPDRWENESDMHPGAYHPFGAGERICLGKSLSLLESHILLAVLAQEFEPQLDENYKPKVEMRGVLGLARGLPMRIAARQTTRRSTVSPIRRVSPR